MVEQLILDNKMVDSLSQLVDLWAVITVGDRPQPATDVNPIR